jgi:hypothetical protein
MVRRTQRTNDNNYPADYPGFTSAINFQELKSNGKAQLSNIIAAGAAIGLMSWYSGDSQNETMMKAGTMAAAQFAGSSLVDILNKSGKIADPASNVSKLIEVAAAGSFYSVVALRGWRLPNANNKQFQEAIVGSVLGVMGGPYIDEQMQRPN